MQFGHSFRREFMFPDGFRNLNHGSFGTYPRSVREKLRECQDAAEERPDKFIRYTSKALLLEARKGVAKLLNVDVSTCVLIANATSGINLVLRNLVFKPGDVIVYGSAIYGACEKIITSIIETTPHVEARKVNYQLPCESEDIVSGFIEAFEDLNKNGLTPKVAVFDTVSSIPALRFPFEQLVEACKQFNVLSCIDGAHGIGQIALDLKELDPDFFVSNCHKWLYTPRGCAVFYVPQRNQDLIRTTFPTSHGFVPKATPESAGIRNPLPPAAGTPFETLFEFVATVDSAPYYCIPEALDFRKNMCGGELAIRDYNVDMAQKAGKYLADQLQTDVLTDKEGYLTKCSMTNVRLPLSIGEDVSNEDVSACRSWMEQTLVRAHDTFVPIYVYDNKFWTRLSGQIYLEMEDFLWLADVLARLCDQVRQGSWKQSVCA